jgi:hypothetical protein
LSADTNNLPPRRRSEQGDHERFSTDLFTTLNIAVFLILAACVAGAALLYSQGA